MRYKKIRGHKRRQKAILEWAIKESNLNIEQVKYSKYDYARFYNPWNNPTHCNSHNPEPNKETKQAFIDGLELIYNKWKIELEKLNQPYYLKIWLYEPRISKSQVVCAIEDRIEFYQNPSVLLATTTEPKLPNYLKSLSISEWSATIDADPYEENLLLWPKDQYEDIKDFYKDRKLLSLLKRKNYPTYAFNYGEEEHLSYFVPKGIIWISQ